MASAAGAAAGVFDRLLRPGRDSSRDRWRDVIGLVVLALLLMATGLGLRDPWPADEPRFALIAQDMLRSGDWLIPRVGGDLYADKPPLYFWLMAAATALAGSLRAGFLLPSLLAGIGTTLLVYDLLRRAHGREVALCGAFVLLLTFQFTWQMRQAQIDGVLCFLTTLSLYGLLRHCLLGPARGWFLAGWVAAGLGVITKGVGFLPLLALVPFAILVRRGWPAPVSRVGGLSLAGLAAMLVAIGLWFVPMMLATAAGGELLDYRNEILFKQTVTRYAYAWHHNEPFYFYFTNVIPVLWLPLVALLPWLWPRWRAALRRRDTMTAVLLAWVTIVVLFFSASSAKRGLYVLPAVPALAMAAAPWLPELLRARGPRRLAFALAAALAVAAAVGAAYLAVDAAAAARVERAVGVDLAWPLVVAAVVAGLPAMCLRVRDGWLAFAGALIAVISTIGLVINPRIDAARSGRSFMDRIEREAQSVEELGMVGFKVQFLLQARRPVVHFGHARWREPNAEAADGAAWLAQRAGRVLVVNEGARQSCFGAANAVDLGRAHGDRWFLVKGGGDPDCIRLGDASHAYSYVSPNVSSFTES